MRFPCPGRTGGKQRRNLTNLEFPYVYIAMQKRKKKCRVRPWIMYTDASICRVILFMISFFFPHAKGKEKKPFFSRVNDVFCSFSLPGERSFSGEIDGCSEEGKKYIGREAHSKQGFFCANPSSPSSYQLPGNDCRVAATSIAAVYLLRCAKKREIKIPFLYPF